MVVEAIKAIILGAGGFLGTKLVKMLPYELFPYYYEKEPRLDITDKDILYSELTKIKPKILVNCAGMTDVDACEKEKKKANTLNVVAVENMAKICKSLNIKLIHFSSDFVFDGKKGDYNEEDKTNPLSYYGKTKELSEKVIENNCSDYLILRVAILYGYNGNNSERSFVKWVYESLKNKIKIKVVNDQVGTPTLIDDIGLALIKLVNCNTTGIYHVAGPEKISRYDMSLKIADCFNFSRELITPIKSKELILPAKRPLNSSLSTEKLKKLGISMHNFEEGLKIIKKVML